MEKPQTEIIRSDRRTYALQIRDGRVIVRVPNRFTQKEIDSVLEKHRAWIEKNLQKQQAQQTEAAALPPLTQADLLSLGKRAAEIIPQRAAHFAKLIGVDYGRITIRAQRTKWGSCSAQGNLSFNCLLLLAPPEVLDSVVVHELCHRKQMNHSPAFYREVCRVMPDYDYWHGWLKEHGAALLARVERGQQAHD